jgi:hypothetical protein
VTIASPRRKASRIGHGLRLNSVFRCPEARVGCFLAVQGTGIQTVHVKPAEDGPGVVKSQIIRQGAGNYLDIVVFQTIDVAVNHSGDVRHGVLGSFKL